jgi:predicted nucleic acid-binding Zn ribbon protein
LQQVLQELVKKMRWTTQLNNVRIHDIWRKVMGDIVARHTSSLRLREKTLFVQLDSAPLRSELSYAREKIRQMLNQELGSDYLQEILIQ